MVFIVVVDVDRVLFGILGWYGCVVVYVDRVVLVGILGWYHKLTNLVFMVVVDVDNVLYRVVLFGILG